MDPISTSSVLNGLFTASWQGRLAVLLVLAVRAFLPVQWCSALWLCILVRLLLPPGLLPSSPASLQNLPVIGKPLVKFEAYGIGISEAVVMGREPAPPAAPEGMTLEVAIPAERGRILDRHGKELAINRQSEGLFLAFPPHLASETEAIAFVHAQLDHAGKLLNRRLAPPEEAVITESYRKHSPLPLNGISAEERNQLLRVKSMALITLPVFTRFYPDGPAFAHLLGFAQDRGKDGLEATFDASLAGHRGRLQLRFSDSGELLSREIMMKAQPGSDLVTTLDAPLQTACHEQLSAKGVPGAIVIVDPRTGNLLAMASWPSFDPNALVPTISDEAFKRLVADPERPLLGRAYRSAYPMGRLFSLWSGIAAVQSGAIAVDGKLTTGTSTKVGRFQFRERTGAKIGDFTLREAVQHNSFTWFYQAGIKMGERPVRDWADRFGFAQKTGIPLPAEAAGSIDTFKAKIPSEGYLAYLAAGNHTTATPLQIAKAMAILANGGHSLEIHLTPGASTKMPSLGLDASLLAELQNAMKTADTIAALRAPAAFKRNKEVMSFTWYAGYSPIASPEAAFAILLERQERHASKSDLHSMIRELLPAQ